MTAIITNRFRKESCERFIDDIIDANTSYFIGIGKTDKWPDTTELPEDSQLFSAPLPNGTIIEDIDVLDNLISLVKVTAQDRLIPRNSWTSGRIYKVYDPYDPLTFDLEGNKYPSYITINDNIYVCLGNNGEIASTVSPGTNYNTFGDPDPNNQAAVDHVLKTTDGYVWAFLQNNSVSSPFYTEEFIPANPDLVDKTSAKAATGGLLYNFRIENGGSNLDVNTISIKLTGVDENGAAKTTIDLMDDDRFTVTIGGGNDSIQSIVYDDTNDAASPTDILTGYLKASVQAYDDQSPNLIDDVIVKPLIAPIDGFGASPRSDLPCFYAGCYASFKGTVDGEALIDTPIRQVSLIKNPERSLDSPSASDNGGVYEDEEALDAVNYIQLSPSALSSSNVLPTGSLISQPTGEGIAYVDKYDITNNRIYYHTNSNNEVIYNPFIDDDDIIVTSIDGVTSVSYNHVNVKGFVNSEYVHNTGKVMFVDHRKKIIRNIDQTEDIKIVVQF